MDGLTSDKPNRQQATAFHIFIKVDKIIPNGNVFSDPFLEGNQIYLKAKTMDGRAEVCSAEIPHTSTCFSLRTYS